MRMWKAVIAGAALLAAQACVSIEKTVAAPPAPAAATDAAPRVPTDIRRVTIIVEDIERSLKLYRDALGMRVNYDAEMTVSGPAFAHGRPGRKVRLVLVQSNDPWIGWIGLFQYLDPPLPRRAPVPTELEVGSHVIVTSVADANAACAAAARAPGVRMMVPPKIEEYPGRNGGPPIRVLGCQIWDADGAYLELNQVMR